MMLYVIQYLYGMCRDPLSGLRRRSVRIPAGRVKIFFTHEKKIFFIPDLHEAGSGPDASWYKSARNKMNSLCLKNIFPHPELMGFWTDNGPGKEVLYPLKNNF